MNTIELTQEEIEYLKEVVDDQREMTQADLSLFSKYAKLDMRELQQELEIQESVLAKLETAKEQI